MAFMAEDGARLSYGDGLIWPEQSGQVHARVPGPRVERGEGAGHSTYSERPEVFDREVPAFVKAHRP
jgi:pimeloyl-ACP methyl ester carboxylesterase